MISILKEGTTFNHKYTVSNETVDNFARLSNDKNPLHTDNEFAKSKGFKSKVVHGNIQNCFISHFVGECLPLKNVMILSQEIKYKAPVYINDMLFLNIIIVNVFDSVKLIELNFNFKNKNDRTISTGKIKIKII